MIPTQGYTGTNTTFNIYRTDELLTVVLLVDGTMVGTSECSPFDSKDTYFYNRLFIQPKHRNKGYGRQLYDKTCELLDKDDIALLIQVNPYGDLSYEQLVDFYTKHIFLPQPITMKFEVTEDCIIRFPKSKSTIECLNTN